MKENKINFFDITIIKNYDNPSFDIYIYIYIYIYRKPTTTDVFIPNDSCNRRQHKIAAIKYFYSRIKTYKLTPENQQKENSKLQQILVNNKYDVSILNKISSKRKEKQDNQKMKWAKFTYVGTETKFVNKVFKITNVKVTFATGNKIERLLSTQRKQDQNNYKKCDIYQLNCPTYKMKYTGQTDSPFKMRF